MKTYLHNDKAQISPHFNVQEFKCKCGGTHNILVSEDLVNKLEQLYKDLNCSKIIINSGYRCIFHDKKVGGNGAGQHTMGNAADIVCYDKQCKKISSKKVSCKAQEVGFTGIANIDTTYTATHVDVRIGDKWYGDETVTTAYSVTQDFYTYYGIKKDNDSIKKELQFCIESLNKILKELI